MSLPDIIAFGCSFELYEDFDLDQHFSDEDDLKTKLKSLDWYSHKNLDFRKISENTFKFISARFTSDFNLFINSFGNNWLIKMISKTTLELEAWQAKG